ncbi:hypothetical protein [Actinoplanes sp. CA-252034]|uniref:hypothetical protein n=1 Tax=Actinoplanes sp. CA-252034 TaxID=3239906 RepID=UPI003D98C044
MSRWPILRYLVSQHLVFLTMFVAGGCLLAAVVTPVFLVFTPITLSAVDIGAQVLFWLAVGYGYSAAGLLATVVSHGRTRREFAVQYPVFLLVTSAVLAALITGAYAAEAVVYRLAGWTRHLQDQRVFEAGDYPQIFVAYLCMLVFCLITGAFVGTAFYRWEGAGVAALLPAAAVLGFGGASTGFFSLPFARFAAPGPPVMAVVTVTALVVGWALLWLSVRDVSLRTRVPA